MIMIRNLDRPDRFHTDTGRQHGNGKKVPLPRVSPALFAPYTSEMDSFVSFSTHVALDDIRAAHTHGSDDQSKSAVSSLAAAAREKGYHSLCLPLTTEKWQHRWTDLCLLPSGSSPEKDAAAESRAEAWRANPRFLHDEITISHLHEAEAVVVMVSEWLELDASDAWVRHDAEIALRQELAYASYLDVHSAILPPPRNRPHVDAYARAVNACLKSVPFINLSIRLPPYDPSIFQNQAPVTNSRFSMSLAMGATFAPGLPFPPPSLRSPDGDLNATWEIWDIIRSICDYNPRLTLTLDLTPPLPSTLGALSRWAAESVRFVYLPASTFIANNKGYPVLPKGTQSFIRDSVAHRPTVILAGVSKGLHARGGETAYLQYVRHLEKTTETVQAAQKAGTMENFTRGYGDYLQAPLQPLMDNLLSATYHVFEQDPVKYRQYEEAVYQALMEWPQQDRIIICVAGAGRGPLVVRCLTAIGRSHREASVYAVEKNPNAFVTLQGRQRNEWGEKVTVLFGDMRLIDLPELADILVTELLGSFGDNELSPECLDGAMRLLKPNGLSIPLSYTAYLAPLSSAKLYQEARLKNDSTCMETPYVVMFEAVNILSGDGSGPDGRTGSQVQPCWTFVHPRKDPEMDLREPCATDSHNARSAKLTFHVPYAGVLHGLAGYFEAVLYGRIGLSIHPHRKAKISRDMLSWFPLFFPFKDPLYLPSNAELHVSIWRLTDQRRVWYEWYAESFLRIPSQSLASGESVDAATVLASHSAPAISEMGKKTGGFEMVKIGHTSLHNPDGRSSWIGL